MSRIIENFIFNYFINALKTLRRGKRDWGGGLNNRYESIYERLRGTPKYGTRCWPIRYLGQSFEMRNQYK